MRASEREMNERAKKKKMKKTKQLEAVFKKTSNLALNEKMSALQKYNFNIDVSCRQCLFKNIFENAFS